ncbi:MAG TPA: Uma2 family endonuclease [Vicinamibacteria bacterium]|nr:Uma2 family endonuclease [Vicinamibacteria bacterium]
MTRSATLHEYTYSEYLAHEAASNVKHEYLDGEIYAMAGGSPAHAELSVAVSSALRAQLQDGPCRVFSSDLRIRVAATGLATYPDVTVVCGPLERDREGRETVMNPKVLVEVLSDGTERYDRGEKFEHYKQIPSFEEYVLLSQKEEQVEVWRREDGSWRRRTARSGERLTLESIDCELVVDDLYRGVLDE